MLGKQHETPEQIEVIIGPPGTGKTRSISERMLDNLYDGSSFVGLRTAWTNAATRNCLYGLIGLGAEKGLCIK